MDTVKRAIGTKFPQKWNVGKKFPNRSDGGNKFPKIQKNLLKLHFLCLI